MPISPSPSSRDCVGSKPRAVVLDHRDHGPPFAVRTMLTRARLRVLDDVRERLLHDPVERGLDLAGSRSLAEPRPRTRRRVRLLGEGLDRVARAQARARSRRAPSVAARPRAGARPAASRPRARAALRPPSRSSLVLRGSSSDRQAEQDRRQRLTGLVVQLAREPPPLELLGLDDAPERVARDPLRQSIATAARAANALGDPEVLVGEPRVAPALSCATMTPIGRSRTTSGTQSPVRAPMRRASAWSTSGSSISESTRSLRRRSSTRPLFDRAGASVTPTTRRRPRRPPPRSRSRRPVAGSAIVTSRASISSRRRTATSSSSRGARSRSRARSPPRSATRAGATTVSPTRTAGRSRSRPPPGCEELDELLVLLGEVAPPAFSVRYRFP